VRSKSFEAFALWFAESDSGTDGLEPAEGLVDTAGDSLFEQQGGVIASREEFVKMNAQWVGPITS
jgi:hypothetical protein